MVLGEIPGRVFLVVPIESEGYQLTWIWIMEGIAKVLVDGEWIPLSDVEAFDIEEDVYGRDIVTFRYDGRVLRSLIVVDSY